MRFSPQQKINLIATTGALGDTCSTFPILNVLTKRGHIEKLFVDNRYWELYNLLFPGDILVNLKDAMQVIPAHEVTPDIPRDVIDPETGEARFLDYPVNPNIPLVRSLQQYPTSIHSHLVDCFSLAICDCILKEDEKDYPRVDPAKLPKNTVSGSYAVIAVGATTEHRKMLPESFGAIVNHLTANGMSVVLVGRRDHELKCNGVTTRPGFSGYNFGGCVDLIDQTTIPEALSIMNDAEMVIGLDNGLIHLAGLTDTAIVAGYTTVDPYYRLPYRHGKKGWNCFVVEPTSDCRFCQTETYATYNINFLRCQTRTKECMFSLTPDRWIAQVSAAIETGISV